MLEDQPTPCRTFVCGDCGHAAPFLPDPAGAQVCAACLRLWTALELVPAEDARGAIVVGVLLEPQDGQACRVCSCTTTAPCPGGCTWAEPGLCSSCLPPY